MISRIHPLRVEVDFENRAYRLGDSVNVSLRLTAEADSVIRKGVAEILCEEHYIERYNIDTPHFETSLNVPPSVIRETVNRPHTDHYVQGEAIIVEDTHMEAGTTRDCKIDLHISADPPPNIENSTANWQLVVHFDVAHARDVVISTPINIVL